jgi:hypothetical protein
VSRPVAEKGEERPWVSHQDEANERDGARRSGRLGDGISSELFARGFFCKSRKTLGLIGNATKGGHHSSPVDEVVMARMRDMRGSTDL